MAVPVVCPNPECGASSLVPEDLLGRVGRCKRCGFRFPFSDSRGMSHRSDPLPGTAPARAPDTNVPERVGHFQIRERLGSGAFGTVYRAYDLILGREVALKLPWPGSLETPEAAERFLREARAAAQLLHPYIVPVYETGEDGPYRYIASALIAGQTLTEIIEPQGIEPRRAAQIIRELAEALHCAHGLGIVHRDVKPGNVLIDPEGRPHLTDFGLALIGSLASKLTRAGVVLGTPAYMAPEQARGEEAGPASDQYALGAVLYELLCGQTPFGGPPQVVLFNIIHQAPPPPRGINPAVPEGLEAVCLKALAKNPQDRYADCRDLAEALRRWLDGESIHPGSEHTGPVRQRRGPIIIGMTSAALILALAGFAATRWLPHESKQRMGARTRAHQGSSPEGQGLNNPGSPEGGPSEGSSETRAQPVTGDWALRFDGCGSSLLTPLTYDGTYPITLEAIVKPGSSVRGLIVGDMSRVGDPTAGNRKGAGMGLHIGPTGNWAFVVRDGEHINAIVSERPVAAGRHVYLAGMVNPATKRIALFINGELQASKFIVDGKPKDRPYLISGYTKSPNPIRVGASPDRSSRTDCFEGEIRWIRISKGMQARGDLPLWTSPKPDASTLLLLDFTRGEQDELRDLIKGARWVRVD